MPRTPSRTPAECEAMLGARGHIRVDSTNRGIVKQWLTAQGFPALFVGGLSMTELGLAYNQTDGSGLDKIRDKLAKAKDDMPEESKEDSNPAPMPAPATPQQPVAADGSIEAAIRAIAESVVPKASGIDESAVLAIIKRELPSLIPVTRIEIITNGETKSLGERPMHKCLPRVISALSRGRHVYLVGPAGSGKTTVAEMAFEAMGREYRIEGVVSGEHKISGYCDAHGRYITTPTRDAFEHGHGLIKDEIDGDDPNALLAFSALLANGYGSFPDSPKPVARHARFLMVGCANTIGMGADRTYVGRNQIDGATLDRFVQIECGYDENLEAALCPNETWRKRVQSLRKAAELEKARLIISPRASINGAHLLADGWPTNEVEDACIWKGCDPELRRRIETRATSIR